MESSVCLCAVLGLWITFLAKKGTTTTTQGILQFLGAKLCKNLCCFLHCHFLQVVFVEVKTTGYQT